MFCQMHIFVKLALLKFEMAVKMVARQRSLVNGDKNVQHAKQIHAASNKNGYNIINLKITIHG